MKRWLLAAALALPVAGLVISIAAREAAMSGASEWRIPVAGYDPRDPLRGRYIRFLYDWQVAGTAAPACRAGDACTLCLGAADGAVTATFSEPGAVCENRVETRASGIDVLPTPVTGGDQPRFSSRIFVSETSAPRFDAMLRKQPMLVVARLTTGGRLVNQRLEAATPAGE